MKPLIALGQTLFDWTWETSIYATLLIALVLVSQRLLARRLTPRPRYTLSLLVLVRLLLPEAPSSVLSFENLVPPADRFMKLAALPPISAHPRVNPTPVNPIHASLPPLTPENHWVRLSGFEASCLVWASGCLCLMSLAGWRFAKWNRLIRQGRKISESRLIDLLNASRETMGVRGPVTLVAVAQLNSPAIFGFWNVCLLLPGNLAQQLDDQELRMIFLHEMAHVRRQDVPLNYLLMAIQYLHWFNPLVWLAFHRLRADRELVCDAMVMGRVRPEERIEYGKVLLKLMDGFSTENPIFSGVVPIIGNGTEIKRRILMIKHHRTASTTARIVTALAVLAVVLMGFTHASRRKPFSGLPNATAKFLDGGPGYHGQTVGYWITKLKQGNQKEQAEAQEALHAMGQSAVPYLVHGLENEQVMIQWRAYAASGLGEIGPRASNAIPALLRITNATYQFSFAAALMKIRGEPIDMLVHALDDLNSEEWPVTARTLAEFGSKAGSAMPALCRGLESGKGVAATYAIGFIHTQPEIAIPALIEELKRDDTGSAAWALGEFEAEASSAIPILRQHLSDAAPMARLGVLTSLQKILPNGELKTLVPDLIQNINDPEPNLNSIARAMLRSIDPKAAKEAGVVCR